jgi:ribosome-associated toxin RatA of RatAB toxin-antitoxin module
MLVSCINGVDTYQMSQHYVTNARNTDTDKRVNHFMAGLFSKLEGKLTFRVLAETES